MSAPILPLFSKLWSSDPKTRIDSSSQLISHLLAAKKTAASSDGHQEPSSSSNGIAVEEDVSYTIKRLVRGLASPRESSRLGFAVALTELLSRIPGLSTFTVLPIILSSSQLPSGVKGPEERDILFARLFGFYALVSSSILFSSSPNISNLHSFRTVVEETLYLGERKNWLRESAGWIVLQATKQILSRSKEELSWRDEGVQVVLQAALDRSKSIKDEGKRVSAKDFWTPEKVALVILLQEAKVPADWAAILSPIFPSPSSLLSSSENLPALSRILRGLSSSSGESAAAPNGNSAKKGKKGSASHDNASTALLGSNGQLHYVWKVIFEAYFAGNANTSAQQQQPKKKRSKTAESDNADGKIPFAEFYKVTIDDSLLSTTSSLSSKYTGLLALNVLLPLISSIDLPSIMTPNLMRLLINHLHKKDRTLHSICLQVTQQLPLAVAVNPSAGFAVLMAIFQHGDIRLDSITRTRTVEGVVAGLDDQGRMKYAEWLKQYFLSAAAEQSNKDDNNDDEGEEDEDVSMRVDGEEASENGPTSQESKQKSLEAKRIWALDQLLLLIKKHTTSSLPSSDSVPDWISSILHFLVLHGYFTIIKSSKKSPITALRDDLPSPALGQNVQAGCRTRLVSVLTHLVSISSKTKGETWVREVVESLKTLETKERKSVELLVNSATSEDSEERKTDRKETWDVLAKLRNSPDMTRVQPMLLLTSVLLLLAYDPAEQESMLEEVRDAVDSLFFSSSSASTSAPTGKATVVSASTDGEDDEGEAAEPISVLIDLLVSLLQRSSVLLRTVAERVFAAYSGEVKEQALGLLLDQVIPEEQIEVADDEDDEDEDEEDGEAVEDEHGGQRMTKKDKKATLEDEEEDEDSDDDSDDDDESDLGIDLDADPELRAKVEAALRSAGIAESEDGEEDDDDDKRATGDEEEELLDDEAMMELDSQLAEIFKAKKAASKESKDLQENSLNSRLKVLDLLEIYAKQQPSNALLLNVILPLFDCARRSSGNEENDLVAKAGKVLRGIVTKPKEYPVVPVDDKAKINELLETLTSVHTILRKTSNPEASILGNLTSTYLSRVILSETGTRNATDVCDVYTATILDYATRKASRVQPQGLTGFVQRFKEGSWALREPLVQICAGEVPTKDAFRRMAIFGVLGELLVSQASLKTDKARQAVADTMPSVVDAVFKILDIATSGSDGKLQVARLRELFKFINTAVRVTKTVTGSSSSSRVPAIWRAEELCTKLANLCAPSSHVKNAGSSLSTLSKSLIDQVLQGTGREKCRDVSKGLPPMVQTNANGKSSDKLARKEKKAAQKQVQAEKSQAKKRKAQAVEA